VQSWNLSSASSQILYGAIRGAAARTVASLQIGSSNRKTTRAVLRLRNPSFVQLLHTRNTQSKKVLYLKGCKEDWPSCCLAKCQNSRPRLASDHDARRGPHFVCRLSGRVSRREIVPCGAAHKKRSRHARMGLKANVRPQMHHLFACDAF